MLIKNRIKYLMYKLGLRETIPASVVNSIKIDEQNERLVDIKKDSSLFFDDKLKNRDSVFVRESVYKKLLEAQKYLPENYFFKIFSAYRPLEEQQKIWNSKYIYFKRHNPDASEEKITQLTKSVCADPRNGFGGHQTGGAVDIGLCDKNGKTYEMGSAHSEVSHKTKTVSSYLNQQEIKNRCILNMALTKVGFVNYPAEWWHYSYGDRMWAAYSGKKKCMYGLAQNSGESR